MTKDEKRIAEYMKPGYWQDRWTAQRIATLEAQLKELRAKA